MKNEAIERPFPNNLFYDLGAEIPSEQSEDFFATLMYVLRVVTSARDSRAILMRYKDGKTFEQIGDAMNISKQRANSLVQSILDKITGNHVQMLTKGMKRYYEDLFTDRMNSLESVITESERQQIEKDAYANGYENGYNDGMIGTRGNGISENALDSISIDTLKLSIRTYNALYRNGIRTLGDVLRLGDKIMALRSFGKGCFIEIADIMSNYDVNINNRFPKAVNKFEWRAS